jgi:hypothetical protein
MTADRRSEADASASTEAVDEKLPNLNAPDRTAAMPWCGAGGAGGFGGVDGFGGADVISFIYRLR